MQDLTPIVAVPEVETFDGVAEDVVELVLAHLPHRLGRHAHDEPARRHHLAPRHPRATPCAPSSTTAPVSTTAPMPMRQLLMTVHACTTARWPIVTLSPTMHGNSGVIGSTELSCTLELRPSLTKLSWSPRSTVNGHTLAPASIVTSPITWAAGST